MARLRFVARGHESHICEVYGRRFPWGQWVETEGMLPGHVKRLAANPTFEFEPDPEAEADAEPKASKKPRGRKILTDAGEPLETDAGEAIEAGVPTSET